MVKKLKRLQRIANNPKDVCFTDLKQLAEAFGFTLARISGSHHIFIHPDIPELINLQNVQGKAKSYQVKQLLILIEKYNLQLGGEN